MQFLLQTPLTASLSFPSWVSTVPWPPSSGILEGETVLGDTLHLLPAGSQTVLKQESAEQKAGKNLCPLLCAKLEQGSEPWQLGLSRGLSGHTVPLRPPCQTLVQVSPLRHP